MKECLVGVDIGGTSIKIGKFDLVGNLVEKWDFPTNKSDSGSHILSDVICEISKRVNFEVVKGIGFGVPGPVSNGIVLQAVNLGWKQMPVESIVRELLGRDDIVIAVGNDANLATAGEVFKGAAQGLENVCLLTLGTGVGGGVVLHGKLVEGRHGLAGEFGHIVIDEVHAFPCNCGKRGCLETVTSATGIVNLAKHHLTQSDQPSLLRQFETFSAKRVFDLAKSGDQLAIAVVSEVADYLAYALSIVTMSIDPDIILFGGGVSLAGKFLIDQVERTFETYVTPFIKKANFALAQLGNDAGIYGAAYLVR
jgi:glucokinase